MACTFRNRVIIVVVIYTIIAALLVSGVIIVHELRNKHKLSILKNYNTTNITITEYSTIPGVCIKCPIVIPPARNQNIVSKNTDFLHRKKSNITDGACAGFNGYYAYAVVSYNVWLNNSLVKYIGNTPHDRDCDLSPNGAIALAEYNFGHVGSIRNGYYLLANPKMWYWYLPGHYAYIGGLVILYALIAINVVIMIIHLCIMFRDRRRETYFPIVDAINASTDPWRFQ